MYMYILYGLASPITRFSSSGEDRVLQNPSMYSSMLVGMYGYVGIYGYVGMYVYQDGISRYPQSHYTR